MGGRPGYPYVPRSKGHDIKIMMSDNNPTNLTLLEKMVLVSEDRRFLRHNGVDLFSVIRESLKYVLRKRCGGASTIDMQFVRTATGYYERTLRRKIYEMFLSSIIQYRYSKIKILRSYLRCAFFGTNIYGSEDASRKMFGKKSNELTLDESAIVASMLVYPRPKNPTDEWWAKVQNRSRYIMKLYPKIKHRFEKLPGWDAV